MICALCSAVYTNPLPAAAAAAAAVTATAIATAAVAAVVAATAAAAAATNENPWYVVATPAIRSLVETRLSHANTRDSRRWLASPHAPFTPELHHSKIDIDTEQPQHYIPP